LDSERVKAQRRFWQQEAQHIDPAQLIFVDESGVTTEMTRRYGRALNGARVEEGVPAGRWRSRMEATSKPSVEAGVCVQATTPVSDRPAMSRAVSRIVILAVLLSRRNTQP